MKKLLFSVLSVFLFSCASDDDVAPETGLAGTWKMTSYEVENPYDFNGDGTASRNLITETNCYQNETIQLNADGSALAISTSYLTVVANLVAGTTDEFTYTLNCETETEAFPTTWSLNNTALSFQEDDGFTVTATLDFSNQFSFTIPQGFEIYTGTGFNVVTEEDITVIYTKQ